VREVSFAEPRFKNRYQTFIGGQWVDPIDGNYFTNSLPVDGQACCEIPRSNKKDVDRAVEAAWQAAKT
jgi:aldehyde dehydrogenase